jgi:TolB-like protein
MFDDLGGVSSEFDDWLATARAERSRALIGALRAEAEKLFARGRASAALPLLDRIHRMDPFDEDVLRLALKAEFEAGRPAAMQRRLKQMDELLRHELGVTVSTQSRALHDELIHELARPLSRPTDQVESAEAVLPQPNRGPLAARMPWPLIAATAVVVGVVTMTTTASTPDFAPKPIAVLPFDAGGGVDPALADGLAEALLSRLSRNGRLRVIGRTSAWQYKGKAADLRSIGRQLGVAYLVEGSVRRSANQMRVTAALVRTSDGSTVWSRDYTASDSQVQAVEASIGAAVVVALGERPVAATTGNLPAGDAYTLFLRAKGLIRQRTDASLKSARELLLVAVRIDPQFAPAWAYLGGATRLLEEDSFALDPTDPEGPSMTTRAAVEHALTLDPNLADAHALLGLVAGGYTLEGQSHLRRAVELDPRNSQNQFLWSAALARQGNYAAAARAAYESASLDPLWQRSVEAAASARLNVGDTQGARRYLMRIRAANPSGADEVETSIAMQAGDVSRAVEIGLGNKFGDHNAGAFDAGFALYSLGFEREGILIGRLELLSSVERAGHAADLATLIRIARETSQTGESFNFYLTAFSRLAREGRYRDIVALYDAHQGLMASIDQPIFANREIRREFGGILGLAFVKSGRAKDAARMRALVDEADRVTLANGQVPPDILVYIAENEAMLGRHEHAIGLLQRAFARGFRMYWGNSDIGQNPMFESLRNDRRFKRLVAISSAHRAKERREVLALHLM